MQSTNNYCGQSNLKQLLIHFVSKKTGNVNNNNNNKVSYDLKNFILNKNLSPVFCYDNLHQIETRKNILLDTKGFSGIYLILNKKSKKYYIGSASTDKKYNRFWLQNIWFLKRVVN